MTRKVKDLPRTYVAQRKLERAAYKSREEALKRGDVNLPACCGYTYIPRRPVGATTGRTPDETICYRTAGAETDHYNKGYCDYHEILALNEVSRDGGVNAARNIAMQSARFFGEPINIDPHAALLGEVHRCQSIVVWLEHKLASLREDGLPDDKVLTEYSVKFGFQPSVWMQLYTEERDRLVKVAAAAIKAGVAERKVQLAEQQARLIASVMMHFLHDPELGLSPQQMIVAPNIVRRHMLSIAGATNSEEAKQAIEVEFKEV